MIDDLIEMAVEELNEIMEKKQKAADAVNPSDKR